MPTGGSRRNADRIPTAVRARTAAPEKTAAAVRRRTTSDQARLVLAAYLAGRSVPIGDDELKGAIRRALLVFAAGGDARRDPLPEDAAVIELARDLDTPQRRSALGAALEMLEPSGEVNLLRRDPELAWRAFACALLADALGEA